MNKFLLTTAVLAGFAGAAVAQTTPGAPGSPAGTAPATTGTQPASPGNTSTNPGMQPGNAGNQTGKPGIQRVEGASTVMTMYTANPADVRASKLMGTNVYNLKDENIGEVSDLVIDNGKTIKAVVVSVGGFLGMGERNVAISPASVVLNEQRDGSFRLVVNTTKDDLKNAAPFDFADVDKAGPDAGKAGATSTKMN